MAERVIVDCDPGCDDAVALLAALGSDAVDVVGVTTVAGNTTVGNATRNALVALDLAGRSVPVAPGCERPLLGSLETVEGVHGPGGLRGEFGEPDGEPLDRHAAEFIVERAREEGDVAILALGPLSNVAVALALEPTLPEMLSGSYVMGGAAFVGGNRTPVAEANFYVDPAAAARTVESVAPRIVGLDVTRAATLTPAGVGGFGEPLSTWLDYLPESAKEGRDGPASPQHDAAALAALCTDAVEFEEHLVEVVADRGRCRGGLIVDERDAADLDARAEVAVDIDVDAFRAFLTGALEVATRGDQNS